MVDEPEQRVRDLVVEAVVRVGIVRNETEADVLYVDDASTLGGDGAVLVAGCARDPCHLVMREQSAQCGDETAAAAPRDALTVRGARERDRTTVGDDNQAHDRRL